MAVLRSLLVGRLVEERPALGYWRIIACACCGPRASPPRPGDASARARTSPMGSPALPAACDVQSRPVLGEWGHVAENGALPALVALRSSDVGAVRTERQTLKGHPLREHAVSHGYSRVEPPQMLGSGLSET